MRPATLTLFRTTSLWKPINTGSLDNLPDWFCKVKDVSFPSIGSWRKIKETLRTPSTGDNFTRLSSNVRARTREQGDTENVRNSSQKQTNEQTHQGTNERSVKKITVEQCERPSKGMRCETESTCFQRLCSRKRREQKRSRKHSYRLHSTFNGSLMRLTKESWRLSSVFSFLYKNEVDRCCIKTVTIE